MQPLAGIAQGLQQVPQQVMQGLQEAVGSPGDKRGVSGEREDERAAKLRERTEERPDTERLDTDAEPARETARPGDHAAGPAPGESTAAGRAPEPARPDGPSPAPTRPQAN